MSRSITSANAVLTIKIPGLFASPQRIHEFAMDSAFQNDAIKNAETTMGVDGKLSAGFVYNEIKQKITLSPDSDSKKIFDTWYEAEYFNQDKFFAEAILTLPATNEVYTFTAGVLSSYQGAPTGKKKLEPVEYELTWESISKSSL